jgi:hypothetical protein
MIEKKMIKSTGSSETTRELRFHKKKVNDIFDFQDYALSQPQCKASLDKAFLEWFIGFFEAEGSLISWFDGKKQRVQIEITQKDPKLLFTVRSKLGFGNVTSFQKKTTKEIYWRYQTSKKNYLEKFIYLFNGNLVTEHKNKVFDLFLFHFNQIYQTNFKVSKRQVQINLETGWLSGFLEGDGGFWATLNNLKGERNYLSQGLVVKFYLTQKNEHALLNHIKDLFKIRNKLYSLTNSHSLVKYNRLETSCLESLLIIKNYLETYGFLGQRQIQVKRWGRLINYKVFHYPMTLKSIKKLKRLIKETKNR